MADIFSENNQNNTLNVRSNVIAGPNPGDYWNHSPGAKMPVVREEGPFPIQGNIGSLLDYNYKNCSNELNVSGSPFCAANFKPDLYTLHNTCGATCTLVGQPESIGIKNFGFGDGGAPFKLPTDQPLHSMNPNQLATHLENGSFVTNASSLDPYSGLRVGMAGQMNNIAGCSKDWIPSLYSDDNTGSCVLRANPAYMQVGDWSRLPMYKSITNTNYKL